MNKPIDPYDSYIDAAAKNMADDIDFEIMAQMLCDSGWTKVVLKPLTWEMGLEIDKWVDMNAGNRYHNRGLVWIFKDPREANWFSLRWLNG